MKRHLLLSATVIALGLGGLAPSAGATDWARPDTTIEDLVVFPSTSDNVVLGSSVSEGGSYGYRIPLDGSSPQFDNRGNIPRDLKFVTDAGAAGLATMWLGCPRETSQTNVYVGFTNRRSVPLLETQCVQPVAMDANTSGDVVVMTGTERRGSRGQRTYSRSIYLKHAGDRAFRRVMRFPVLRNASGGAIAIGESGAVQVAWQDGTIWKHKAGATYARYRTASGHWQSMQRLGTSFTSPTWNLDVAVLANDRRLILWHPQYRVPVIATAKAAERFRNVPVGIPCNQPHFAVSPHGARAIIAGHSCDGARIRMEVMDVAQDGTTSQVHDIALPGAGNAGWPTIDTLAVADNGLALLAWSGWLPGATHENQKAVMAAVRPAGNAQFSAADVIDPDGRGISGTLTPDGHAVVGYNGPSWGKVAIAKP